VNFQTAELTVPAPFYNNTLWAPRIPSVYNIKGVNSAQELLVHHDIML